MRNGRRLTLTLTLAALAVLGVGMLAGCSDDSSPTLPGNGQQQEAPVLPDPGMLTMDLHFFDGAAPLDKAIGHQNFYNAYLRAVIVSAYTGLVLAAPVEAFSLALHTTPTPQSDGSWLWIYTWSQDGEEAQIRLHGMPADADSVRWELRVTFDEGGRHYEQELWFDGTTADDGHRGTWTFYDFKQDGAPAVARLAWHGTDEDHSVLRLAALAGEDEGDSITFTAEGDERRIDYVDAPEALTWFVRWNEADGTGSLQVPGYNGGEEACWDEQQFDVDCGAS